MEQNVMKILGRVAHFYDERKVGDVGFLGFRRSTDLCTLVACMPSLIQGGIIRPEESCFLDLGCADGRVNVFLSYVVKSSVGVELEEWILEEYGSLRRELDSELEREGLPSPPENIFLFHGDSMDEKVHRAIFETTGMKMEDFDIFYTYLTMLDEFAEMIAERATKGSVFMVYGLAKILPNYKGLRLLEHLAPLKNALTLYRKE